MQLEGYTYDEIKNEIDEYVMSVIEDNNLDITFVDSALHGSRIRGNAKPESDLDYVFEYKGDEREYVVFNIINDDPYYISGMRVDINPINADETCDLQTYMQKSRLYDKEIMKKPLRESGFKFEPINESRNLHIALDLLTDDQVDDFKEWLIQNKGTEDEQLSKILDLMNDKQIKKYHSIASDSDIDFIKQHEEEIKKQQEEDQYNKLKDSAIVNNLLMWMENTERLYNIGEVIVNSLLKKVHKGIELDVNVLAESSYIDKLVRETINDYQKNSGERPYISPLLRKVLKREFAKSILIWVDDWK